VLILLWQDLCCTARVSGKDLAAIKGPKEGPVAEALKGMIALGS
jgi:hypothetical protein